MVDQGRTGTGRARARGRAATENLLRDAALRLLERDGVLSGISLQDVADEAGLSRGLIHHYFGSRQALLRSALEARRQEAVALFEHRRHRSPAARFKWFWRGTIRDPHWATMMALLAIDGDESFEPIHLPEEVLGDLRDEIDAGVYGCASVTWHTASDGVRLHVEVTGPASGATVVMVHGFAGSVALAWDGPDVIRRVAAAGRRVIAFDLRGHGRSDAPLDEASYGDDRLVRDLGEVVAAFADDNATAVGYSMGAAITLLAFQDGLAVRTAVIGAAPPATLRWTADDEALKTAALAALEGASEPDPVMAAWIADLERTGVNRRALAAVLRGHQPVVEHWDRITVPVLVIAGHDDLMAAPPAAIAARLANGRSLTVPGDHFGAVATPEFVGAILEYSASV
jgi:pimeloyl-ACP methyl ester carboxylesterase